MQEISKLSCEQFIESLSSGKPTPGGGSTSALVGALGMALGNMVVNLTLGKPKYAGVQDELKALHTQSKAVQDNLTRLIEKDVQVFTPLAAAYGMPTGTEEERVQKAQQMEVCLRAAAEVPLEIMAECIKAIDLHARLKELGSKLAISDVGVGVALASAALRSAGLNVYINTKSMLDKTYAQEINEKAENMLSSGIKKAEDVYLAVSEMLK